MCIFIAPQLYCSEDFLFFFGDKTSLFLVSAPSIGETRALQGQYEMMSDWLKFFIYLFTVVGQVQRAAFKSPVDHIRPMGRKFAKS